MQFGLDFNLVEELVAGVDEVGRGPWAGPVTACAVILDPMNIPDGLEDSKKLSAKRREALAAEIRVQDGDYRELESKYSQTLQDSGFDVDYLKIANADSLAPAQRPDRRLVIAVAAKLGTTRLIDNLSLAI